MSANKIAGPRRFGSPIFPRQKPMLRLLKPNSECSTIDLIIELPQKMEQRLRGQKRQSGASTETDAPETTKGRR
jgi:hypothetical protein